MTHGFRLPFDARSAQAASFRPAKVINSNMGHYWELAILLLTARTDARGLTLRSYEIGSGNLLDARGRSKHTLDATWGETFKLRGAPTKLLVTGSQRDQAMLSKMRLSGAIPSPHKSLDLSYAVAHSFPLRQTAYRVHATLTRLGASITAATPFIAGAPPALICDAPSITEVALVRSVGPMQLRSVFSCTEGLLRLNAETELGGGKHRLTAEMDVPLGPKRWQAVEAEVGLRIVSPYSPAFP